LPSVFSLFGLPSFLLSSLFNFFLRFWLFPFFLSFLYLLFSIFSFGPSPFVFPLVSFILSL
jgi:hypothetical protein